MGKILQVSRRRESRRSFVWGTIICAAFERPSILRARRVAIGVVTHRYTDVSRSDDGARIRANRSTTRNVRARLSCSARGIGQQTRAARGRQTGARAAASVQPSSTECFAKRCNVYKTSRYYATLTSRHETRCPVEDHVWDVGGTRSGRMRFHNPRSRRPVARRKPSEERGMGSAASLIKAHEEETNGRAAPLCTVPRLYCRYRSKSLTVPVGFDPAAVRSDFI